MGFIAMASMSEEDVPGRHTVEFAVIRPSYSTIFVHFIGAATASGSTVLNAETARNRRGISVEALQCSARARRGLGFGGRQARRMLRTSPDPFDGPGKPAVQSTVPDPALGELVVRLYRPLAKGCFFLRRPTPRFEGPVYRGRNKLAAAYCRAGLH